MNDLEFIRQSHIECTTSESKAGVSKGKKDDKRNEDRTKSEANKAHVQEAFDSSSRVRTSWERASHIEEHRN